MAGKYHLQALLSAVDKITPVAKQVARNAKKYLHDVGSSAHKFGVNLGLPMAALGGLSAGFGIAAIKRAMVGYSDAGEAIYKGSLKVGMSVAEYQRLRYVAEQSGVAAETMESSMGRLNKTIGAATTGKNADAAALFRRLHISLRDTNGQLLPAANLVPQLADAFVKNENAVLRSRMGNALFGKQWADFMPVLMEGSEGIERLSKRFKRLGVNMSLADALQAKEWNDLLFDMNMVSKDFQYTIAKELVPALSPLLDEFIVWAAANKKIIAVEVKKFVLDLIEALRKFDWKGLIEGLKSIGRGIAGFVDMVGGAKNAVIGLAVVMNSGLIVSAFTLFGSLFRLGGGALLMFGNAIVPMKGLATLIGAAASPATAFLLTLLKIGAALLVIGAGVAGWFGGKLLNKYVIDPGISKLAGEKTTLGSWLYDQFNETPNFSAPTILKPRAQGPGAVSGALTVKFENAPPGMRVTESSPATGLRFDTDVGYRSVMGAY